MITTDRLAGRDSLSMKIHSIAAEDFLSFASLALPLRSGTTIVTGPNGAGKSNLASAVALPLLVLERGRRGADADPLEVFQQAGRHGVDAYVVSLDIELDQAWEEDLVRCFVEAAVASAALEDISPSDPSPRAAVLSLFTELGVAADSVRSLLRGTLVVAYNARQPAHWWAAWNFRHSNEDFQFLLEGPGRNRLQRGHILPWMDGLVNPFRATVPPLGHVPDADRTGGVAVLRSFLREGMSERAGKPQPSAIDFSRMLDSLDQTVSFVMQVQPLTNGNARQPVSLGMLARALGYEHQQPNVRFEFRSVLAEVLRRGVVLTDNRRLPLVRHFPLAALGAPVDLRDGSGVAAELFRLKNGDRNQQQRFEQAREIFTGITGLSLHLRSVPADDSTLSIDILVGEDRQARIAQFAGAGIQEALLLAALLAGEPGQVVVLDEPAVNLHPTMQRRLARRLADVHGIVITHSPDLIMCSSINDLDRVVRLTPHLDGTRVATLSAHNKGRLGEWLQNLLLTDVRALLFASAVILCEGSTELGALGRWWQDGAAGLDDPQGANISLIDVSGDNNFGGYVNYLEAFQIPWAAVADGPAFVPTSGLSKQLAKLGLAPSDRRPDDDEVFQAWLEYWNRVGVFTVADTFGRDPDKSGEFEAFLVRLDETLLEQTRATHRTSKPRIGAAFAAAHPDIPDEIAGLYQQIRDHLASRTGAPRAQ
ncbi:AAA family ATPase [Streptomyces sp. NBC_00370]|uniref:AAA family ATPase n=1 Tax=Streptomyces sp. NBC_00370 TaxID=2975728 RepID=UPI002E25327E